jgi:hypothetical protein
LKLLKGGLNGVEKVINSVNKIEDRENCTDLFLKQYRETLKTETLRDISPVSFLMSKEERYDMDYTISDDPQQLSQAE